MKSYDELLSKENSFGVPVLDVHEFLSKKGMEENFLNKLKPLIHEDGSSATEKNPYTLVFHDACHMIHGQGIYTEPRELLKEIPFLKIYEAKEAGVCCGSAGIYNIVQPKEAAELGRIKAMDLISTNAEMVISANIGCTMQLRHHIKEKLPILHPMQLLAKSARIHYFPRI